MFLTRFYTECFGMKLTRKRDVPEEKYSNAFLAFGPEESNFAVELTYSMTSSPSVFCYRIDSFSDRLCHKYFLIFCRLWC